MLKGYIDAYWVKNSNMKKSPNQNGKKFRGRWGNCWNMKKFPNCGWMCREGLGEYLEWQKNTQCRRKCYRNAVPFALRCASCSCRAGALCIQSEIQPLASKLPTAASAFSAIYIVIRQEHNRKKDFLKLEKPPLTNGKCAEVFSMGRCEINSTLLNIVKKCDKSVFCILKKCV